MNQKGEMNLRFDGKTVLITGGSRGIGYACAELFGRLGANVSICARKESELREAAERLSAQDIPVYSERCDVSQSAELERFAAHTAAAFGGIDIWVGNAAVMPPYSILNTTEEVWQQAFAVNVQSVYAGARIAVPYLKQRGGVMLLASSFAALFPSVGTGAYAATKAAVHSMVRTLAAECAPFGIRVNGYLPGVIDTDINRERIAAQGEKMKRAIALRDFGRAEDVAYACAFLASPYARYITGTCLEITGGKMIVQNPERAWEEAGM